MPEIISPEDKLTLQTYDMGWKDCSFNDDNSSTFEEDSILEKAYRQGWSDYILGDELSNIDLLTEEEILERIKRHD